MNEKGILGRSSIERLNNEPREYDLSKFPLIAECIDGKVKHHAFKFTQDEMSVYAIQIGGELYIGSSKWLSKRVYQHYSTLIKGENQSKRLQIAYNNTKCFKVYLLMRCDGNAARAAETAEQMFIRLLRPSLNVLLPTGKTERWNGLIWSCRNSDE